jgi:hypothetical protein
MSKKQHWSKQKGVVSGTTARQRAAGAHRREEIKSARKARGTVPAYRETGGIKDRIRKALGR